MITIFALKRYLSTKFIVENPLKSGGLTYIFIQSINAYIDNVDNFFNIFNMKNSY